MARLKNIEKVAQGIGGDINRISDDSASSVFIEDQDFSICITFDWKGDKFRHITIAQKIYQVVDEKVIARVEGS